MRFRSSSVIDGEVGSRASAESGARPRLYRSADAVHSYRPNGSLGAMLFVDPESAEGVWLRTSLRDDITFVPETRLEVASRSSSGWSINPSKAWPFPS